MEHERFLISSVQQPYSIFKNQLIALNDLNIDQSHKKDELFEGTSSASSKLKTKLFQKRPGTTCSNVVRCDSKCLIRQSNSGQEEACAVKTDRRQKAQVYQEQLKQQIEEKRRLLTEEQMWEEDQVQRLERRLEEQRQQMLEELERERQISKQRLERIDERESRGRAYLERERQRKACNNHQDSNRHDLPTKPRSASYLYVRTPKNTAPLGHQQFRLSRINLNENLGPLDDRRV